MAISGGDDWRNLLRPLRTLSDPFWTVFFVLYVAFVVFGMMNVLTAIFVESGTHISDVDKDLVIQEEISRTNSSTHALTDVFKQADVSGTGQITLPDLNELL